MQKAQTDGKKGKKFHLEQPVQGGCSSEALTDGLLLQIFKIHTPNQFRVSRNPVYFCWVWIRLLPGQKEKKEKKSATVNGNAA